MRYGFSLVLGLVTGVSTGWAQVLYDNGPVVTHPGQGAGGADVSMCSSHPDSAGANMLWQAVDPRYFRVADDWVVPAGQTWNVSQLRLWGYATNAPPGFPGWTFYSLKIWRDQTPSDDPANFYQTTAAPAITFSGVYRVFNGIENLMNTERALNRLTFSFSPALVLPAGTYWFDLQVGGGTFGWYNFVMDINPRNPYDPITRVGNAMQRTVAGWVAAVAGFPAPPVQVSYPFEVIGTVSPPCPGTGSGACSRADWNEDGVIDFNDFLAFLNDFNTADPCADLNSDGVVDFNDFLAFFNIYSVGC
jgi:hypothetical protein